MNSQIYSEASDWLVEFRSGDIDPRGRREFHAWLRTSPEHMRAYLELAAIWNEGEGLDAGRQFDDERLQHEALAQPDVVAFDTSAKTPVVCGSRPRPGRKWHALAASFVIVLAGAGGWLYLQREVYATAIGENRSFVLSDGSRIELNAASRVRVHFSSAGRRIELLAGQALFSVAKDNMRPFVVESGGARVQALGTRFDVYRKRSGTTVSVIEGRVAVIPASPAAAQELDAGEQALVTADTAVKQTQPDIRAATAWTQGRLVFQGAPLQEVADEFNRHNRRRLVIRDPKLAAFHVTGVFSSTDPASLILFLEGRPGVVVTPGADEISVSSVPAHD